MIEYLAPNGKAWNPSTGCLHGKDICPTSDKCWARDMSRRFDQVCGGDFQPRFHTERLDQPLHWRKPRRVATCFMGDLFGRWNSHHLKPILQILDVVERCPQHSFLFLTKNPLMLHEFNPWPENTWVGISITGAETLERQEAMREALRWVEGPKVKWLSYEPALGPLSQPIPYWIDWVVVGAQSGSHAKPFNPLWMLEADWHRGVVWMKNNLRKYIQGPWRQELPA